MACYIPRWYTRPKTVTHPGTNRARRALTSFMRRTLLLACKNPMNPWMMDALLYYLCDRPLKIVLQPLKVLIRPGSFLSFVYFPCPASADFFVLFRAGVGEVHGNTAEKFDGTECGVKADLLSPPFLLPLLTLFAHSFHTLSFLYLTC